MPLWGRVAPACARVGGAGARQRCERVALGGRHAQRRPERRHLTALQKGVFKGEASQELTTQRKTRSRHTRLVGSQQLRRGDVALSVVRAQPGQHARRCREEQRRRHGASRRRRAARAARRRVLAPQRLRTGALLCCLSWSFTHRELERR